MPFAEDIRARRRARSSGIRSRHRPRVTRRRATSRFAAPNIFTAGWRRRPRRRRPLPHVRHRASVLQEIVAATRAGSRVIATTHSSSLGFLCQRGTLMWQGRRHLRRHRRRRALRRMRAGGSRRGSRGRASRSRPCRPALGGLARTLPGPVGTALAMTDLIDRNSRAASARCSTPSTLRRPDAASRGHPASPTARRQRKVVVNRLGVRDRSPSAAASPPGRPRQRRRDRLCRQVRPIKGVLDLADAMRRVPRDVPLRVEFRGPAQTAADRETKRGRCARVLAGDPRVHDWPTPCRRGRFPTSSPATTCCVVRRGVSRADRRPASKRWRPACR